jgi:hypothetical protein
VVHILIWDKRKSQINEYSDSLSYIKKHKEVRPILNIVSNTSFYNLLISISY